MDRRQIAGAVAGTLLAVGATAVISSFSSEFAAHAPQLQLVGMSAFMLGAGVFIGLYFTAPHRVPSPDMLIGDLFHHVRASIGGDHVEWSNVGTAIQNELSLGLRLKAWGKQVAPTNSLARHLSAQTEMTPEVWTTGRFSYWFLDPPNKRLTDYFEKKDGDNWQDWAEVYVNRRQALKIWPTAFVGFSA